MSMCNIHLCAHCRHSAATDCVRLHLLVVNHANQLSQTLRQTAQKAKKRSERNSESQQTARQKLSTSNSRSIKNVDRRRATLRRGIKYKANNNKSNNKRNITQCKKVYFAFILAFRQHLYGQHGGQYRQMVEA